MGHIHTLLFRISRLGIWVLGAGYMMIAFATTLDVTMRNMFAMAVPGVYEISGYIFAIATTWGFSFVLFERAHVRIDVVYQKFGTLMRAWADVLALLAMALFIGVLTYRAWTTLEDTLLFGSRARTTLQTPLWIPQSLWLAGMGFFLLCLVFLAIYALLLILKGRPSEVAQIAGIPHVISQIKSKAP